MKRVPSSAFSLVEVVLALGICAFVLVALIGLFSSGLRAGRESEDQVQAANLASQIIALRMASPTNGPASAAIPPLTSTLLASSPYTTTNYVGFDGLTTNSASAAYRMTCKVATNALTGSRVAQVYLALNWPVQSTNNFGRYETVTYIALQ